MQVKKRLQINVVLSVLTACLIIPMLIMAAYRINGAVGAQQVAGEIIAGAFERVALRNDYMRNDNERAKVQWAAKHEQIGLLLKSASREFTDPEDRALLADLSKDHESIFNLFSSIVENREKTLSGVYSRALALEIENRLINQLNMRVFNTVLLARRLHEAADDRMSFALRFFGWGVIAVIGILVAGAIGNSWSMRRTIADRIERLRNGASVIGEGHLDHRIDIAGDDEFAELSRSFNTMTEKLRRSYGDLEKEIEERNKMNKELQRTATLLDETQAIARVGGWELDPVENTLYWTDETFRIHETSPAEYTPNVETAIAFYAPASIPAISAAVKDAIEQGKEFFLELQLITAKGRLIWVETAGKVIRRNGRTVKVLGAFRDVTERKQAEAAKQSSAYHRSLLEASLDPLVTISADGTITDVNVATEKVTGHRRDELIGTDFSDYFTDPAKARAGYLQVFREGSVTDYALEIRRTDGHITPVLYNAAVYRNESGSVIGVFAAARDVTERKQAEEKLKLANAYNRSLLEASLDPLVTISADGTITDVNIATEKVTGRRRDELIGTDFSDYFTDPAKARAGYQQVFREGSVTDYALEIRRTDGHITPVLYNAAVYRDDSGSVIGVFAAARDITERKKAEEEINKLNRELEARVVERTTELENSNKELEAFAYSVSHDLRSPLRSIEGFSLALLEDYAGTLDDTAKSYLNRVRNATIKMGQLIDDLLKLSRVTRREMNRERVDLSAMASTIADNLKKQHPGQPAEFIIANGLTSYCDGRLLTVALENLFANAWKFSEKSPGIVIEFGTTEKNEGRTFFVKDNGVGFDMTYAGKLFNPFQRLHRTEEFPGTGIGLATVKRIVTRHGGRVWIESEMNKGTTVYFTLG
jgi:PAS domain S-box-containing protein